MRRRPRFDRHIVPAAALADKLKAINEENEFVQFRRNAAVFALRNIFTWQNLPK